MFPRSAFSGLCLVLAVFHSANCIEDDLGDDFSSAVCGGNITKSSGKFNYTAPYPGNLTCTWIFRGNKSDSMLYFKKLNLAPNDYVKVSDASGKQIAYFTGQQSNQLVYVTPKSKVVFFSAANQTDPDLGIRVLYNKKCNIILPAGNGQFITPLFAGPINKTLKCTYGLKALSERYQIGLTFLKIGFKKASLQVLDRAAGVVMYNKTGEITSVGDIISVQGNLQIKVSISLLSNVASNSFQAAYTSLNKKCSHEVDVISSVSITTPGFPLNYTSGLRCWWLLTAPLGSKIQAVVNQFNLADALDLLTMTDGNSRGARAIGVYNSINKPVSLLLTSGNSLWLQFTSDIAGFGSGFNITFSPQDFGGAIYNDGQFSLGPLPNSTSNSSLPATNIDNIIYQLIAPHGSQIYLTFDPVALLWPTALIECYDGLSENSPRVGLFTSQTSFHPVFSNGDTMLVVVRNFVINGTLSRQHIAGSFFSVENDGTLYNSVGDDGSYELASTRPPWESTWLIHNHEPNSLIALRLDTVKVEPNSSVHVYQGPSTDLQVVQLKIDHKKNDLPLIYLPAARVNYATSHKKPNITKPLGIEPMTTYLTGTYERVPACNYNITTVMGKFTSPYFPSFYPYNARCSWLIMPKSQALTYPNSASKSLYHFAILNQTLASNHSITVQGFIHTKIGNSTFRNMTQLAKYTGRTLPIEDLITSQDEMSVIFSSEYDGSPIASDIGFSAFYEKLDCGGYQSKSNGTLSPPKGNVTCLWIISLPAQGAANGSVNIVSFQYQMTNTSGYHLELHDGSAMTSPSVSVNTSDTGSGKLLSRINRLWIRYSVNTATAGQTGQTGFSLNYTTYECAADSLCDNGICMHPEWKCNGHDNCGDGSDEQGCTCGPAGSQGVPVWGVVLAVLLTALLTLILTLVVPVIYRRIKYPNYSELRDLMTPVPT